MLNLALIVYAAGSGVRGTFRADGNDFVLFLLAAHFYKISEIPKKDNAITLCVHLCPVYNNREPNTYTDAFWTRCGFQNIPEVFANRFRK